MHAGASAYSSSRGGEVHEETVYLGKMVELVGGSAGLVDRRIPTWLVKAGYVDGQEQQSHNERV